MKKILFIILILCFSSVLYSDLIPDKKQVQTSDLLKEFEKNEPTTYTLTIYEPTKKVFKNVTSIDWQDKSLFVQEQFTSSKVVEFYDSRRKHVIIGKTWLAIEN